MTPQSAKAKGRKLQQKVRDAILATFTNLTSRDVRSVSMGSSGVDIILSEHAVQSFPYSVECKSRARMAVYDLWHDTVDNVADNTDPLLVIKVNNEEPLAVITLEHFMKLAGERNKHR